MNLWEKLIIRIKNIANNKGQCDGTTIVTLRLYFCDGELVAWEKPERIPIEPKQFPLEVLPLERDGARS